MPAPVVEWTEPLTDQLARLWATGMSANKIAVEMFDDKGMKNAVIGKARRLGLSGRGSPIRRESGKDATPEEIALIRANPHRATPWFMPKMPERSGYWIRTRLYEIRREMGIVTGDKTVVRVKKGPALKFDRPKKPPVVKLPRHIPVIDYGTGPGCCTFLFNDRWPWKQYGLKAEYDCRGFEAPASAASWCGTHLQVIRGRKLAEAA